MIKAFLFDYDGVITKGADNDKISKTLAAHLNVPQERVREWVREVWRPYMTGKITEQDVWAHLESRYGKRIDESQRDIWFTWEELTPLPEMISLVKSLKARGIAVGVVSNAFRETVQTIEEHGGYDLFDFRIVSCEAGYSKPDEDIFYMALKKLNGISPHEVVYLDDREKNAIAADQLGMLGIYVTNHVDAIKKARELANIEKA